MIKYIRCPYCQRIWLERKNKYQSWSKDYWPDDLIDDITRPDESNVTDAPCQNCLEKEIEKI